MKATKRAVSNKKWTTRDKRHVLAVALWSIHGLRSQIERQRRLASEGRRDCPRRPDPKSMLIGVELAAYYVRRDVEREW